MRLKNRELRGMRGMACLCFLFSFLELKGEISVENGLFKNPKCFGLPFLGSHVAGYIKCSFNVNPQHSGSV